jgi:protein-tyrosine-phosphatase
MPDTPSPASPPASPAPGPGGNGHDPPQRGFWAGTWNAITDPFRRAAGAGSGVARGRKGLQREKHKQIRLLFVDVGNASRSQVAQAFGAIYGFHAESAGTFPSLRVADEAVACMTEIGVDIGHFRPKPLDVTRLEAFDRVVAMGDALPKPWSQQPNVESWNLLDPQGMGMDGYRRMRDDCEKRIRRLAREYGVERPELVVLNA